MNLNGVSSDGTLKGGLRGVTQGHWNVVLVALYRVAKLQMELYKVVHKPLCVRIIPWAWNNIVGLVRELLQIEKRHIDIRGVGGHVV